MTKKEKNLLLAFVLGDGCINKRIINNTVQCRFLMRHSQKQEEYFKWKVQIIKNILDHKDKKNSNWSYEDKSGRSKTLSVRFERNHPYFKDLYSFIYENGKKTFSKKVLNRLDPMGIAIWYMDDGSLYNAKKLYPDGQFKYKTSSMTLNTYLSEQENNIIAKWFKDKYDINWRIEKDKGFTRLKCGTIEARKLVALIEPYIVPSMKYKIEIKAGTQVENKTHPLTSNVEGEDIVQ